MRRRIVRRPRQIATTVLTIPNLQSLDDLTGVINGYSYLTKKPDT